MLNFKAIILGLTLIGLNSSLLAAVTVDKLPKNFRRWAHTKSMVIPDKAHGLYGFHNIYANKKAYSVLKKGGVYPDGAAFVVSFYEVKDEKGTLNQGAKIMDAIMVKEAAASETAGWRYNAFDASGKAKPLDPVKDCYQCHTGAKATDSVFHKYID